MEKVYQQVEQVAANVDITLASHVISLHKEADNKLKTLEKKMLRAEKRKYEIQQRHISRLKETLFPKGSLQERVDNFAPYYACYGKAWLEAIFNASLNLEQQFAILEVL